MLDLKALPVLRQNLAEFIKADPIIVSFSRMEKIRTPAGGWTAGPATVVPEQQVRMVTFKRRLSHFMMETQDGKIPTLQYTLVCKWNADIRRDDTFTWDGNEVKVISIEPKTDDRSRTDRVVAELEINFGDPNAPHA